jgi:hypothetical protein
MQMRVIMAAIVGLAVGVLATSCDERPLRLDDENVTGTVAGAVLTGVQRVAKASSTRAETAPAIDWSQIFVIEDELEAPDALDEEPEEVEVDPEEELAAFTRYWSAVLEGDAASQAAAVENSGEDGDVEPELEDATTDEELASTEESEESEEVVSEDGDVTDEQAVAEVDLSWVDEELSVLQERIVELEFQVEQQRREIDTMALAMAVQARRVTVNENVTTQLAAALATCRR